LLCKLLSAIDAARAAAKASSSDIPALGLLGARQGLPGVVPRPDCLLIAAAADADGGVGLVCSVLKGPVKKLEIFDCPEEELLLLEPPALAAAAAAALLVGWLLF